MDNYTISDIGKARSLNEDSTANYFNDEFSLFIVCDGMGGHNAGDVASKIAAERIQTYIIDNKESKDYEKILNDSIVYANNEIYRKSLTSIELNNMGTTVVAAIVTDDALYVANVGDSRAYIYVDGQLTQITKDHSLVFDLVEQGVITKEEASHYPGKNAINRAVGTQEGIDVDLFEYELNNDGIILLCTDGLTNMVNDSTIKDVFETGVTSKDIAENLVYIANENGGYDNITATVCIYRSKE